MNRMKVDASETEKGEGEYSYKDVNGTPGPLIDFCGNLGDQEYGWVPGEGLKDQNHLSLGWKAELGASAKDKNTVSLFPVYDWWG